MNAYLIEVRDILRDSLGDHMVASTVFAKRIPTIVSAYETGISAKDCARSVDATKFSGCENYESA